jgi:hypothetical protein
LRNGVQVDHVPPPRRWPPSATSWRGNPATGSKTHDTISLSLSNLHGNSKKVIIVQLVTSRCCLFARGFAVRAWVEEGKHCEVWYVT